MSTSAPIPQTIQRLKSILRRDLKLGVDALLDESTPLLGGQHDLDSLDILLLLTSVEKEFNIKFPKEALRQHAFRPGGVYRTTAREPQWRIFAIRDCLITGSENKNG